MSLRELATAWVEANCPSADVQHRFLHQLDDALSRSVGCSFVIGRNLTRSGTPYLIHCFCGELFAFQLTPRQAARLKVDDSQLISARGVNQHDHEPHLGSPVRLVQVDIDRANARDLAEPITGTLKCHMDQWWAMPLAIQAVCEPVGRTSLRMYHHLEQLPRGENVIRFRLPPIGELRDREGQPYSSVLPLKLGERFIPPVPVPTLMTPETMVAPSYPTAWHPEPESGPDPNRIRAISDIHAVLVEVA